MAILNSNELSNLPLSERIKKLKQIESESRKNIDEAKKLIKEAEKEIRAHGVASAIAPEQEQVDISKLFKQEEGLEGEVKKKFKAEEESFSAEYTKNTSAERQSYTSEYNAAESSRQAGIKIEDQTTYKSTSMEASDKSVTSKSILDNIKKYTKG